MNDTRPILYLIVCAAGPAPHAPEMIRLAQERGWTVCVIPTPSATAFIDAPHLEALTGQPVRSHHRKPDENRRLPRADALIVAPATYNTINKWAHGIADNYALSLLAELVPLGVPTAVIPFVNTALAANPVLSQSIAYLRSTGVHVIYGPGQFEPHPPGTGGSRLSSFPWHLALDAISSGRSPDGNITKRR